MTSLPRRASRDGFVIIAVLLVVAMLALAAYQYVEVMTAEYKAADSAARAAQARATAASGVYYAACMLADPNSFAGTLNSNPYDNEGAFHGIAIGDGGPTPRFQARFSIVAPPRVDDALNGSTAFFYGVEDEHAKINVNAVMQVDKTGNKLHDMLMLLPNMAEEIADAIVDWIDTDDDPRANGAESDYYSGLGYMCKNGPLDTIEELLFVRGVTPELLFGSDKNKNGIGDPEEMSSGEAFDRGWSAYLTVFTRERNVDSTNATRININATTDASGNPIDTDTFHTSLLNAGLTTELADFIVALRVYGTTGASTSTTGAAGGAAGGGGGAAGGGGGGATTTRTSSSPITYDQVGGASATLKSTVPSLFALVSAQVAITSQQTTVVAVQGRGGATTSSSTTTVSTLYNSPLMDPDQQAQMLPILFDKCTTSTGTEVPARINMMTASDAVLTALTALGLEDTDVDMIQNVRPTPDSGEMSDPIYRTPTWLLTEANISAAKLQAMEKYITSSSQVYRVQSVGYFDKGGPAARIEAMVDTNGGMPRIVYWRDLTELGKGFDIAK